MDLKQVNWSSIPKSTKLLIKNKSEKSLINFVTLWFQIIRRQNFKVNWHHRIICDYLQDIITDKYNCNLILNIPPGAGKTELGSTSLQAYCLALALSGKITHFRNLTISFNKGVLHTSSQLTKDIVLSEQFQELWGGKEGGHRKKDHWTLNKKNKTVGENVYACSGGQITGHRAGYFSVETFSGFIIMDDIQKPEDALSETKRLRVHSTITGTILNRRAREGKNPTPIINIQQRLHEDDASGHMLKGGMGGIEFERIIIPAVVTEDFVHELKQERHKKIFLEYIENTPYEMDDGKKCWSYWEAKESIQSLLKLKKLNPYVFYSQKQQDPQSMDEKLFDVYNDIHRYNELPRFTERKIVIDTNSGKEGDFYDKTVLLFVGCTEDKLYILESIRGTFSPDILKHMLWAVLSGKPPKVAQEDQSDLNNEIMQKNIDMKFLCEFTKTDHLCPQPVTEILIEDKQAGQGLIVELEKKYKRLHTREQRINIVPVTPNTSKLVRHQSASPHLRAADVLFPQEAKEYLYDHSHPDRRTVATNGRWLHEMIEELRLLDISVLENKNQRSKNPNKNKFDDQYDCIMHAIENKFSNKNKTATIQDYLNFYK